MNLKRATLAALAALLIPGAVMAQGVDVYENIVFRVTKDFTDDSDATVAVTLVCNSGTPNTFNGMVSEDSAVTFTVPTIVLGEGNYCMITETVPVGYKATYLAGNDLQASGEYDGACYYRVVPLNGDTSADTGSDGSIWMGRFNTCEITNAPDWVDVTVNKTWNLEGVGGDDVSTEATIAVKSAGKIKGASKCQNDSDFWCTTVYLSGDDSETIKVRPSADGTKVRLTEKNVDSSVEATNDCDGQVKVYPGQGAECSFENTVFFESIPTMNQYGLAIMALLMLGVGFVGFRRFV